MSPVEKVLSEARKSHCVACLEPLRAGARRCPHCQAAQHPQRWQLIGNVLKWAGGVTALLSLFLVLQQVNNVISTWTERQETVAALVMASDLQASTGDYAGAWGLLEQALALEPGSTRVQAHRVDLAMLWLRNIVKTGDQTFTEIVTPLLPSLYLGAVRSDSSERADALAHIGWSNVLRARDGIRQLAIDKQFDAALAADPDNVFAHTWQATWLYSRENNVDYDKPRIDLARKHFDAALATGQRRQWVRNMQLWSYTGSYDTASQIEAIAVVASLKAEGGTLPAHATIFEQELTELVTNSGDRADVLRKAASSRFTWDEILDVYTWVLSMRPDTNHDAQERYALARLTELTGEPANALTMYRTLLAEASEGYGFSQDLKDAVTRLEGTVSGD